MHRWTVLSILLFVSMAGLSTTHAQESYALQYKFEKGKTYHFGDTMTVSMSTEMMGQEMKSTSNILSVTRAVTSDILDNGSTVFVLSADTMNVAVKSSRGDTTIVPRELLGKRTRLTLSKLGDVSRRETIDTVILGRTMRGLSQRESIRFVVFSPKPVKIGEKWTSNRTDTSDAMGGKLVVAAALEYTLVAKEKYRGTDCLKISYAGKMSATGKGTMMGMDLYIEGSGTISGTVFVDPRNGQPLWEESKSDMETTTAITGQQNMTIPSSQSVVSHRVLVSE